MSEKTVEQLNDEIAKLAQERDRLRKEQYQREFREKFSAAMIECLRAMCDDAAFHARATALMRSMQTEEAVNGMLGLHNTNQLGAMQQMGQSSFANVANLGFTRSLGLGSP